MPNHIFYSTLSQPFCTCGGMYTHDTQLKAKIIFFVICYFLLPNFLFDTYGYTWHIMLNVVVRKLIFLQQLGIYTVCRKWVALVLRTVIVVKCQPEFLPCHTSQFWHQNWLHTERKRCHIQTKSVLLSTNKKRQNTTSILTNIVTAVAFARCEHSLKCLFLTNPNW